MRVLLCAICKLENRYIREWIEYHKDLGFDNIVLYDNNDIDGERFEEVIADYIQTGYVIIRNKRGLKYIQIDTYNECYREFHYYYDWIGFWDIDEFLEFEKVKTIQEFLGQNIFSGQRWVRFCWKQYTDNNIVRVDGDYSVKRFTEVLTREYCDNNGIPFSDFLGASAQCKSIVKTDVEEFKITSGHVYMPTIPAVNAVGQMCFNDGVWIGTKEVWEGAWLNHYRFKTIEEYVLSKMVRLWPTDYKNGGKDGLTLDFFFEYNKRTPEIVEYANSLLEIIRKEDKLINQ